ncbi:MAG TPA: tripartite tricarboxylate transporter TctB family protein [Methylomirabilota bacterium]
MITSQRIAGGVLVLIGAVALWEGLRFPFGTLWRPGPAYVPAILSLVLIAIGVVLIAVRHGGTRLPDMQWRESRHAVAILAVCAFIALTLERLGWRLAVAAALLVLLGLLERRGAVFTVVLTVAIAFGSFYLFHDVLRVPLPRGALGF